ncbi:MAG: SAM-dependent methyltransferase [Paracoccaceae bacterium]|jgi:SAM-dependent methyltransferase
MAKDRFSTQSDQYQQFRPSYPQALFQRLAALAPGWHRAWDCGCGSGQASVPLAQFFDELVASDLSWQQLSNAGKSQNITYCAASSDLPPLAADSLDLILVAQALHWFNLPAFFAACDALLKPRGVLAVLTYNLLSVSSEVDAIVKHLYFDVLGQHWDAERKLVESAYADIEFPFVAEGFADSEMQCQWNRDQLLGYLGTWSAVKQYRKVTGQDALERVEMELNAVWPVNEIRAVCWPLRCIVQRKSS